MESVGCVTAAGVGRAAEMEFAGERIEIAQLFEGHGSHKAA